MMNKMKMTRVKAGALRGPFAGARWLEVAALAFGLLALALLAIPHTAHGQGIVRGAQQGAYEGSRVAGPVGGVVGGAVGAGVGGAVGAVEGVFGIPYRGHYRCRGYYNRYGHFHCYR